jgi:serine/threonine protein kinase
MEGSTPKIGDFGISKFVDESTRQHTFKGGQHPAYMAPEGWQSQTNTPKLDVYSVGLVFYEILASKHPLLGKVKDPSNFLDWQKAHLYEQCPDIRTLRGDIPVALSQLLSRMTAKRPNDRPAWDEVLNILSSPEIDKAAVHPAVNAAVEAAVARQQQQQQRMLEAREKEDERQKQVRLYQFSCKTLLQSFDQVIAQFNSQFQHGQITRHEDIGTTFRIPSGHQISVVFFAPQESRIKIRSGELIGGGWIGISDGRSASLVLLKQGSDDLYGHWVICEIGIMALADGRKLIGQFGLTEKSVLPFGFRDSDFYEQMRWAAGGLHVFTYNFIDSPTDYFAQLLAEACK